MSWMILGGGGVFGLHLARHLLAQGARVVCVGRNPIPAPAWRLAVDEAGARFRFEQVHIVHEFDRLTRLMEREKPAVIVNFAALAYATSWEDSWRYFETNVVALARITEWLTGKPWLQRFVQIGTSELYGSTDRPAREDSPVNPTSPYAVSKMAGDLHLLTLKRLPAVIMRPSNCYGEAQQLYRIVPRACWSAAAGERMPLHGGGMARKSFMHAADLARAIEVAAVRGEIGRVYNAGPETPLSMREIVETVSLLSNLAPGDLYEVASPRDNEDQCYWLDSSRMRRLGWAPTVALEDGIRRVQRWVAEWFTELGAPQPFVLRA